MLFDGHLLRHKRRKKVTLYYFKGSKKHILLDYKRHLIYNLIDKNS